MKVNIYTVGCKVNQYESDVIAQQFIEKGFEIAKENEIANIYVVNTCSVTHIAERKSRQFIQKAKKQNPKAVIAVTGCYAQRLESKNNSSANLNNNSEDNIEDLLNEDIVCGINNKYLIPEATENFDLSPNAKPKKNKIVNITESKNLNKFVDAPQIPYTEDKTRALIKVQEGCNRSCSYCVIPSLRGQVRSRKLKSIIDEAKALLEKGHRELVLTGINTALYGSEDDFNDECLKGYPEYINGDFKGIEIVINELNKLLGDFRIRLSSLEATVIDADFVKRLFKYDKLCHHLHMSLQSGSDNVLNKMNRGYTVSEFLEMTKTLREFDPIYGISTDIIVGFPGETEDDFYNGTLRTIENVGFSRIHEFPYSQRPNTEAIDYESQVSTKQKKKWIADLKKISQKAANNFVQKCIGKEEVVLFEKIIKIGDSWFYTGYTDNYLKAYLKRVPGEDENLIINNFIKCKVINKFNDGVEVRR